MLLSVILHMLLLSYVTCDIFKEIFEMSFYRAAKAAEMKLGNMGTFNNCGKTHFIKYTLLCRNKKQLSKVKSKFLSIHILYF